ncbi:hypothetical protein [Acinetobacter zhairhuonensis]|uniref:hypothetical protein n=1 Tax=Acinetobacter sp. A7.4 TaxID=2919921 RepID=UPI001F4D3991|nr:hypothetical protein [Acinetobacter sp. A7.4]MCJ8160227.1 hypothetical protein [Acinetobacter sp. A7.4]
MIGGELAIKPQIYMIMLLSFSIIALALYFTFKPLNKKTYLKDLLPAEMTRLHSPPQSPREIQGEERIVTLLDHFMRQCHAVTYLETKAQPDFHFVFENNERIVSYMIYQIDEDNFQMQTNQQVKDSIWSGVKARFYECDQKLLLSEET